MMRVTVEIVPFGQEEDKYTIHTIEIGNMGRVAKPEDSKTWCRYNIWLDGELIGENVQHAREDGALALVEKSLTRHNLEKWVADLEAKTKEKSYAEGLERKAKSNEPAAAPKMRRPQRKIAKTATGPKA